MWPIWSIVALPNLHWQYILKRYISVHLERRQRNCRGLEYMLDFQITPFIWTSFTYSLDRSCIIHKTPPFHFWKVSVFGRRLPPSHTLVDVFHNLQDNLFPRNAFTWPPWNSCTVLCHVTVWELTFCCNENCWIVQASHSDSRYFQNLIFIHEQSIPVCVELLYIVRSPHGCTMYQYEHMHVRKYAGLIEIDWNTLMSKHVSITYQ